MSKSKKAWRAASWPILAMGFASPLLTNCGGGLGGIPGAGNIPGAGALRGAPTSWSSTRWEANIEKADLAGAFQIDGPTASSEAQGGHRRR